MIDDELAALERLANGATPGPWPKAFHADDERSFTEFFAIGPRHANRDGDATAVFKKVEADADFMAAASPATILDLVAEVRSLRAAQCCNEWRVARQHHGDCPLMARDSAERTEEWRRRALDAEAERDRLRAQVADLESRVEAMRALLSRTRIYVQMYRKRTLLQGGEADLLSDIDAAVLVIGGDGCGTHATTVSAVPGLVNSSGGKAGGG